MIKVLSVVGTRPEAIKMAPLLLEMERHRDCFESKLCATGQHRQMLDQVLNLFRLTPDYDLNIMRPSQSLNDVMTAIIHDLDSIMECERPDWVIVQGDTTTAMAASLVAFHRNVRVGHVEAGLRTHDMREPFPEEFNRRIISLATSLHFAPTPWAAQNLQRESVPDSQIAVTGNTVIDALQHAASLPFDYRRSPLEGVPFGSARLIVVTCHRRENHGARLVQICCGLQRVAEANPDVHLVCPVHPNPLVHKPIHRLLGGIPNITLLPPLEYQPMVWLLSKCHFVITDSGGLQEEAPGLGKPVLVLRDATERPEGVLAGTVRLVGADGNALEEAARQLLTDDGAYKRMSRAVNPYGDGKAAVRIAAAIEAFDSRHSTDSSVVVLPSHLPSRSVPTRPLDILADPAAVADQLAPASVQV